MASKNTEFGKRLSAILVEKGLKQRRVADLIGISAVSIGMYVKGRIPEAPILLKLSQLLHVSMEELLTGKKNTPEPEVYKEVHIYGLAADAPKKLADPSPLGSVFLSRDFCGDHIVPIRIKGGSMEPFLSDGAIVGVDTTDLQIKSGRIYAVWFDYEGAVIKRIFVEHNKLVLRADNPQFPPSYIDLTNTDINFVLGRVVWVIQNI